MRCVETRIGIECWLIRRDDGQVCLLQPESGDAAFGPATTWVNDGETIVEALRRLLANVGCDKAAVDLVARDVRPDDPAEGSVRLAIYLAEVPSDTAMFLPHFAFGGFKSMYFLDPYKVAGFLRTPRLNQTWAIVRQHQLSQSDD